MSESEVDPVGKRHYEYRVESPPSDAVAFAEYCNNLDREGWELVGTVLWTPRTHILKCVFRRELQEETT